MDHRAPTHAEGERERLFETIANYTYDWETWFAVDGRPLWVNPAVERMTGYGVDACLAMADYPLPLVHEDDRAMIARTLASAAEGSSDNDVEFRIRRKDGSIGWGAVSWQPVLDAALAPLGFRTSVRDITLRKEAEEALRRARNEAELADRAKSKFLAAASHDLRQPLQAISTFVGALNQRTREPECRTILDYIRKCLGNTDELLDALLDISRLDAGVLVPAPQDFAVGDLIERLEAAFGGVAAEKGLALRTVACSAVIRTDPLILGRILQNLVANAVRYTEYGRILIGCRRAGARLAVEVWDTGIGIPEAELDAVFDEFYQIGNPERDRTRGLGLGLAIVRRQARLLEAPVRVRSRPGRGSVFAVELPLAAGGRRAAAREAAPAPASLEGYLVVAIDDEPMQLEAIRAYLRARRCTVITATTAREAAAKLANARRRPDVILADYRLRGEETGVDAIESLRARGAHPIAGLLLTGDTHPKRLAEAQSSGFRLVHKPVDPETLVAELIAAIGKSG